MIGQSEVYARLERLTDEGRLPHAVLLCGPGGCGKMAVALRLAARLLEPTTTKPLVTPSPGGQACSFTNTLLTHPDLHFAYPVIRPTGTSSDHRMSADDFATEWTEMVSESGGYFAMDEWLRRMRAQNQQALIGVGESERLLHRLSLQPACGGYRVCVIWLPERMNDECANKLLKLLEEPPRLTVFIMVCQQPELLLETIRSRTQRIDLHALSQECIEKALVTERGLTDDDAHRVARAAGGSWLQALEMLRTDNERQLFLDMFKVLMRAAYRRDVKGMKSWTDTAATYGREQQRRMLRYFLSMVRESFVYNFRRTAVKGSPLATRLPELNYMTGEEEDFVRRFSPFINEANVIGIATLMERVIRDIGQNANPKIQFFDMALNITVLLTQKTR